MSMLTLFESRYTLNGRCNIGNVGKTASMSMLTLFESRYTLNGRCNIGNVGKTASMSMLTLFESRYTLNQRYSIGNVGKTASMSMLTLFESRYALKGRCNIGNVGKTASMSMLTLFESRYTLNRNITNVVPWSRYSHFVFLPYKYTWPCTPRLEEKAACSLSRIVNTNYYRTCVDREPDKDGCGTLSLVKCR